MASTFRLEHHFPTIPIEKFIAHLNDPNLNQMIEKGLEFKERRLLKRKENLAGIEWEFSIKKCGIELPKILQKFFKHGVISWHEKSILVRKENCIHWQIFPDTKLIPFHGSGVWKLEPMVNGCIRIIEGSFSVDIPILGKTLEKFLVDEILKNYRREPLIQEKFYDAIR
jgi:hypothetical protein